MTIQGTMKEIWGITPAALVAAAFTALNLWLVQRWLNRNADKKWIADGITKLIDLSMTYPKFDVIKSTSQWPKPTGWTDEDKWRYENYCNFSFNLISRVFRFCNENKDEMEKLFHFREIIDKHHMWWELNDRTSYEKDVNIKAYGLRFCKLVNQEIGYSKERIKQRAVDLIGSVKNDLTNHGSKLVAGSKTAITVNIEKVESVRKGVDFAAIISAVEALRQASYPLSQHVRNAVAAAPEAAAGGAKPDDGVIDAEFEKKS